jgi:predicted phosphodiesterase
MHVTNQASVAYPRKVIQAMNAEGGDLVLACGDLGSKPTRPELELAREVLDELKAPYYPVLGNHDALFAGEQEETLFRDVVSHYPFVKGVKYRTKNADDVQALFKSKRLLAMISGHFHGNTERRETGWCRRLRSIWVRRGEWPPSTSLNASFAKWLSPGLLRGPR